MKILLLVSVIKHHNIELQNNQDIFYNFILEEIVCLNINLILDGPTRFLAFICFLFVRIFFLSENVPLHFPPILHVAGPCKIT